ncbi:uncharacterized protein B0I36DRAFT_356316 [Microdochium trichocladiopsis]|uniref:Uncharacterized protein n=1 Tax=Microdochium trichocladiopsis TaxID=1682393 RepID=A0A9P8XR00_9PEZI|nr:uncharacterized protein B0I36DRAFT_356316 [Microdochium trichocladiopsis]KAH7012237.1 hypothetical protein B0I36DRAFT_356316 [Microdochium trichocladiopsis]
MRDAASDVSQQDFKSSRSPLLFVRCQMWKKPIDQLVPIEKLGYDYVNKFSNNIDTRVTYKPSRLGYDYVYNFFNNIDTRVTYKPSKLRSMEWTWSNGSWAWNAYIDSNVNPDAVLFENGAKLHVDDLDNGGKAVIELPPNATVYEVICQINSFYTTEIEAPKGLDEAGRYYSPRWERHPVEVGGFKKHRTHREHVKEHVKQIPSSAEKHLCRSALVAAGKPDVPTVPKTVQLAVRYLLETDGGSGNFIRRFISWMSDMFPEAYYEHWDTCHHLYPLVKIMAEHRPTDNTLLTGWALVLCRCSRYAREQVWLDEALPLATKSHNAALQVYPPIHELCLESKQYVGRILRDQGLDEEAETIFSDLWTMCKEHSISKHPLALTIGEDRAFMHSCLGEPEAGLELIQHIVHVREECEGPEGAHPTDVVGSYSNKGMLLRECGKLPDAVEVFKNAIKRSVQFRIPRNHPDMLIFQIELATTYRKQGKKKLSAAVALLKKALARWADAEKIYINVVKYHETNPGNNQSRLLQAKLNLACAYDGLEEFEKAENQQRAVMRRSKEMFGESHLLTAQSMDDLAFLRQKSGDYTEALDLMRKCLAVRQQLLGAEHEDTIFAQDALTTWSEKYAARGGSSKRTQTAGNQSEERWKKRRK